MGKPNVESFRIASIIQNRSEGITKATAGTISAYRDRLSDGLESWTVFSMGNRVLRIDIPNLNPHGRKIAVSMGGWPDSSRTRNNINSMLMRFGSAFRVGVHKGNPYLYELRGEEMAVVVKMDATAWYNLEEA